MRRLRTQVIVNPESNQGRTRHRWKDIKEAYPQLHRVEILPRHLLVKGYV